MRIVGQDAHQHRVHAERLGGRTRLADQRVELLLELGDAIAGERLRIAVRFDLELAELGREVAIAELVEHREHAIGRRVVLVDEEDLLLGADPAHAGLERLVAQHALERAHVREDRVHELAAAGRIVGADFFMRPRRLLGHVTSAPPFGAAARSGGAGPFETSPRHFVHSVRNFGSIARQVGQS